MDSLPVNHHPHISLAHSQRQRSLNFFPRSSFPTPFSSVSPIRASSSPKHNPFHKPQTPLSQLLKTLYPLLSTLVKPTSVAIAATAFFFMRLHPPSLAAEDPPSPSLPSTAAEILSDESAATETLPHASTASETLPDESAAEEQPSDEVVELESLLQTKMRAREIDEAILVLNRLIELEPGELEYPFLKANLHMRLGEHELAAKGFEDLLERDPFHVETHRCLLMVISETKASTRELLKKIEETVKVCEEEERDSDVRDFKLLIAQIKVIDGDLSDALKVYEELVKEEPKDFRPYLCQGIVYTMLKKSDEAEKQFQKYRTLVPENHPYKQYFEDNSKILETGRLGEKSLG
ncbi:unnamed protein product [Sphenostylis stenocarpa]|uniref:Uncharacterized protein n=1 Tax=Sphenostylis stenocarpa TaxID=92480 RepID=A0AA86SW52_9FABA|nr:unnamed protein product [Sphenostylis stenocarpa]